MTKQQWFTVGDAPGSRDVHVRGIEMIARRISRGDVNRGYTISSLAGEHELVGLCEIALGSYSRALGHFAATGVCWADLLERKERGEEIAEDLLDMAGGGPFLFAVAARAEEVIQRLARVYEALFFETRLKHPTHYFAMIVRALAIGDIQSASEMLLSPPPKVDEEARQFWSAVVEQDRSAFVRGLGPFVEWWRERIRSERLQKYPDAVCDHYTFGRIKLAERVWGTKLEIDVGDIPKGLYSATAEPIDPGI